MNSEPPRVFPCSNRVSVTTSPYYRLVREKVTSKRTLEINLKLKGYPSLQSKMKRKDKEWEINDRTPTNAPFDDLENEEQQVPPPEGGDSSGSNIGDFVATEGAESQNGTVGPTH